MNVKVKVIYCSQVHQKLLNVTIFTDNAIVVMVRYTSNHNAESTGCERRDCGVVVKRFAKQQNLVHNNNPVITNNNNKHLSDCGAYQYCYVVYTMCRAGLDHFLISWYVSLYMTPI